MTYPLNFSFEAATADDTITVVLKNSDGSTHGTPTIDNSFNDNTWYAYTLEIPNGFQGYASFSVSGTTVAQFAINPSEFQVLPTEGTGGIAYSVTVTDNMNHALPNVAVWVTTDQAGTIYAAGTIYTNDSGIAVFALDAGNYYLWRKAPGYTFDNPALIVVS